MFRVLEDSKCHANLEEGKGEGSEELQSDQPHFALWKEDRENLQNPFQNIETVGSEK